jgi:D-arginine dehydrogenase
MPSRKRHGFYGASVECCDMTESFDIIVIGAGIAGASLAAHLAEFAQVAILDMEDRAGYHTTSRSASSYEPNYGPKPILALTRASRDFFMAPPAGFTDTPIFTQRGSLVLEAVGQEQEAQNFLAKAIDIVELSEAEARAMVPVLREGYATRGFLEAGTGALDVDLLHRGYLRLFKQRGGALKLQAGANKITKIAGQWHIKTPQGEFTAKLIVNASGAWGDQVADLAGVKPVGLIPKRRSIGVIAVPDYDLTKWPFMVDCAESWYTVPQSGKLLVSSADATPVIPHDAYADDEAIAIGIDRLMQATTLDVQRLEHSWGGLRTFSPDTAPVVGFDPSTDGFFWLVGQGGYGIQSSPALSRTAAAMVLKKEIPQDVLAAGLEIAQILPDRFRV